jgi:hypothetical protein
MGHSVGSASPDVEESELFSGVGSVSPDVEEFKLFGGVSTCASYNKRLFWIISLGAIARCVIVELLL